MALQLRARIRMNGPISVAEYMREVLTNPVAVRKIVLTLMKSEQKS